MMLSSTSRRAGALALAIAIAATLAVGVAASTVPVAAQENDSFPEPPDEYDDGNATDSEETYLIAIDDATRVVSADWSGGTVTIELESDLTREVIVTDASQEIDGAVDIRRQRVTVPRQGTTEIEFSVRNDDDAAVTVATRSGIVGLGNQGGDGIQWFDGPATWGIVALVGIVGSAGSFWGTKRYLENQEHDENERAIEVIR